MGIIYKSMGIINKFIGKFGHIVVKICGIYLVIVAVLGLASKHSGTSLFESIAYFHYYGDLVIGLSLLSYNKILETLQKFSR